MVKMLVSYFSILYSEFFQCTQSNPSSDRPVSTNLQGFLVRSEPWSEEEGGWGYVSHFPLWASDCHVAGGQWLINEGTAHRQWPGTVKEKWWIWTQKTGCNCHSLCTLVSWFLFVKRGIWSRWVLQCLLAPIFHLCCVPFSLTWSFPSE